jgi:hypothetical protein
MAVVFFPVMTVVFFVMAGLDPAICNHTISRVIVEPAMPRQHPYRARKC